MIEIICIALALSALYVIQQWLMERDRLLAMAEVALHEQPKILNEEKLVVEDQKAEISLSPAAKLSKDHIRMAASLLKSRRIQAAAAGLSEQEIAKIENDAEPY